MVLAVVLAVVLDVVVLDVLDVLVIEVELDPVELLLCEVLPSLRPELDAESAVTAPMPFGARQPPRPILNTIAVTPAPRRCNDIEKLERHGILIV